MNGPGYGIYLFITGITAVALPQVYFKHKGPTDDGLTNMLYWMPLEKVLVIRGIILGGFGLICLSFFT